MIVDLKLDGKYVVLIGGGSEGYRKTLDFIEGNAQVVVVSQTFSAGISELCQEGKIRLQKEEVKDADIFVEMLVPKPDVLVAVTNNMELNAQLIKSAKSRGCMVYAPDNPSLSDFILPATAKVGEVRIAISTNGRSPAMASVLRKRIEKLITPEDLLQVKLQDYLRSFLRKQVKNQKDRKEMLYRILQNNDVGELLKQGKFDEAREKALEIMQKS